MSYILVDTDSGDVLGFYDTERAALDDVRQTVNRFGAGALRTTGLALRETNGRVHPLAEGDELAHRATRPVALGDFLTSVPVTFEWHLVSRVRASSVVRWRSSNVQESATGTNAEFIHMYTSGLI